MNNKFGIIYCHKNKINNKVYIGQTTQNTNRRWRNGEGYKGCPYFYRSIKKYGWDNFDHIILEENLEVSELNEKEKFYIQKYNSSNPKYGYNLTNGGEGCSGYIFSENTRKILSEQSKKRGNQIIFNGIFYYSLHGLADDLEENYDKLRAWIIKRALPPKWFADATIIYKGELLVLESLSDEEKKERKSNNIKNSFIERNLLGENNPNYKHGKYVGQKKSKGIYYTPGHGNKGYKWTKEQKLNKSKKVVQMKENEEIIKVYDSLTQASLETGFSISGISSCCNNRLKHFHHFIWRFV